MFSVLILTLNEERPLPACLASVTGCDDVVVLDSGSADRTIAIARDAGARVFAHPFTDFAQQRNYAHREIPFRHPWVFHLDADERMTPALQAECRAYGGDEPIDGCYVAPRMLWEGRWIRHSTDYPAWQARFVKAPGFAFVQVGHGQREAPSMRMGRLAANYLHDLSVDGTDGWLAKHRRYAVAEAAAFLADDTGIHANVGALFGGTPLIRRRALKHLSYRLPGRPAWRWIYQYLLRGGFLDGGPGFRYCRLLAAYEGIAAEAIRQLRSSRHQRPSA